MKYNIVSVIFLTAFMAGCNTVVVQENVSARPTMAEIYHDSISYESSEYCYWSETPVYGYADVYRDGQTHVRIKQVAYVDRKWRCH